VADRDDVENDEENRVTRKVGMVLVLVDFLVINNINQAPISNTSWGMLASWKQITTPGS
jgi:hypothetical protein